LATEKLRFQDKLLFQCATRTAAAKASRGFLFKLLGTKIIDAMAIVFAVAVFALAVVIVWLLWLFARE